MAIALLPDRASTYNCSALSFISIDLIQNWPPRTRPDRRRIKIIKLTVGFCLASSCDIHPAGNPTVRQLPGAIAITDSELSIQCHLASSFQLVDVAGSRRTLRQRSIAISSNVDLTYFANRHAVERTKMALRKRKQPEKVCARNCINTRVASLFSRT